ncbi:MAG: aminotransferase class V-fold PLP-dependent enzyme [Anaerolineae bacterium]|nr:aminotransferase class V-fold PLP-dependent enzyme [Candidatus Jacksonbacteria bacterium]MBT7070410.1 aminotransferase class V-fold PLP-dependent enzyme [Anaerolineae bacterium]MBT7601154.1 aminotransferase class V-fold PLP-dependent enzyme [Anaerolineae bacterium]MBT7990601.1 aminotransferase class V-fold PLP-dependent enzyme [Anaerolineae bacterium]
MEISAFLEKLSEQEELYPYVYNRPSFDKDKDIVYYSGPYWDEQEVTAIIQNVLKGKWLASGESVHKFEVQFSKKFNHSKSLMVNSGSSANLILIGALKKYYGWQDGDEIIVSVAGFPTTISPILQHNLKPVFVDISWDDLNWDLRQVADKIGPKTKAIFSSPVLGNPYNIDTVLDICKQNGLLFVSDNCDSLGSKWNGKYLTDYSVASSCSFYPAHHITTGEGGMVSSNEPEIIRIARSMAWWGRDCYCVGKANTFPNGTCGNRFDFWLDGYDSVVDHKYIFSNIGYNLKPLDLQGAVGLIQLEKFAEIHRKRREHKLRIQKILENAIQGLHVVSELPNAETSWFGTPIICETKELKTKLVKHLEVNRIQTRNYFAGNILLHPAYRELDDFKKYPQANQVLEKVFFLGCSPAYTEGVFEHISNVVNSFER